MNDIVLVFLVFLFAFCLQGNGTAAQGNQCFIVARMSRFSESGARTSTCLELYSLP